VHRLRQIVAVNDIVKIENEGPLPSNKGGRRVTRKCLYIL
jgi:hypothetical protein